MNDTIPKILFKYKSFSINSLDSLIKDTVYLADPITFNDPFDCQPSIIDDLQDIEKLREVTTQLIFERQSLDLFSLQRSIMKYIEFQNLTETFVDKKPLELDDQEFLEKFDQFRRKCKAEYNAFYNSHSEKILVDIDSFLKDTEDSFCSDPEKNNIFEAYEDLIKSELLASRNLGVLSLAKNNNCPLMWAHYADDHQGFCCGYRLPGKAEIFTTENKIKAVDYEGERTIRTSQLYKLVVNADDLKNTINDTIFYVKAESWQYEKEYRMIGTPGLRKSPFILDSIYFGLRCKDSVKFSIMSALANRKYPVNFYQMEEVKGSFDLKSKEIKLSDIHSLPIAYVK